jgi:hypothetical protein
MSISLKMAMVRIASIAKRDDSGIISAISFVKLIVKFDDEAINVIDHINTSPNDSTSFIKCFIMLMIRSPM